MPTVRTRRALAAVVGLCALACGRNADPRLDSYEVWTGTPASVGTDKVLIHDLLVDTSRADVVSIQEQGIASRLVINIDEHDGA